MAFKPREEHTAPLVVNRPDSDIFIEGTCLGRQDDDHRDHSHRMRWSMGLQLPEQLEGHSNFNAMTILVFHYARLGKVGASALR